ncbi:MAG: ASPIC/UnbV domain-containing protein, partial [Verrucomicrobiales bacterium]|nr:ASPIC/UnbV domain-containing protein [Verrucomicrobiales bacterium]
RAGDAFLSQSSKWLHFGCGEKQISRVDVSWPGGDSENFKGLKTGDRAKLRQGTGKAEPAAVRNQAQMAFNKNSAVGPPSQGSPAPDPGAAQILLPAKIPLPKLTFQNGSGELPTELGPSPAPKLLFFWSAGCPNCTEQISRFAEQRAPAGLHLINIDAAAAAQESADPFATAREKLSLLGARNIPLSFAPPETLARLAHFQRALFDNHIPFAVPFAILTDGNQNAVAIYRGEISNDILETHTALANATNATLRSKAVPFPGRWFTNAITPAEMAAMTARLFLANYPADAAAMFERAMNLAETAAAKKQFLATAFSLHHQIARQSATMKQPEKSRLHFRQAIDLNPQHAEIRCDFGALLANHQQFAKAEAQFRKALELRPDYPLAKKNLDLLINLRTK